MHTIIFAQRQWLQMSMNPDSPGVCNRNVDTVSSLKEKCPWIGTHRGYWFGFLMIHCVRQSLHLEVATFTTVSTEPLE